MTTCRLPYFLFIALNFGATVISVFCSKQHFVLKTGHTLHNLTDASSQVYGQDQWWERFYDKRRDPSLLHCIPGEAYMRLITASCEAGPGATPMCTFDVCMRRILILDLLTDVSFEILHSACESGICTLN
jgi:hypothetical protein